MVMDRASVRIVLAVLAGWLTHQQQDVIAYLRRHSDASESTRPPAVAADGCAASPVLRKNQITMSRRVVMRRPVQASILRVANPTFASSGGRSNGVRLSRMFVHRPCKSGSPHGVRSDVQVSDPVWVEAAIWRATLDKT
jgi:hypothetical protein